MPNQPEIKAVRLLQERIKSIETSHVELADKISSTRARMEALGLDFGGEDFQAAVVERKFEQGCVPLEKSVTIEEICREAEQAFPEPMGFGDIISVEDFAQVDQRLEERIQAFNRQHNLDGLDYAIAGFCGLFAGALDCLFVKAPPKPSTTKWQTPVDGVFNRAVQKIFNKYLSAEATERLEELYKIGTADASNVAHLIGAPDKALNPNNHRLRSLSHDPVLGFIFGVLDMLRGTCTIVNNGRIVSVPGKVAPVDGNIFQLLGRMFGHLLSDVNAQSGKGNRGMGLPAPFMGLLRMLEGIPVGDSNFGEQVEWMYVNGYDFRQFVVTSVPMTIMEVMMRALYVGKQMSRYDAPFGKTMLETMPFRVAPRFRMMLAMGYGTSSAVNAGKIYISRKAKIARKAIAIANGESFDDPKRALLDLNYASWMGLGWNGFHALKWSLIDRNRRLWGEIEQEEIVRLENLIKDIENIETRVCKLHC
ncbi:hypothetical protein [Thalassospira sp.]|uniref:hypothetical protein n=1 Tax=Thalassospira sp. TaxID=1912094 RepID=UPI0032EDCA66